MIRIPLAIAWGLLGTTAAGAQAGRNIPAGSPLGSMPIMNGPPGSPAPAAIDPAQAWLRAQQAAVARARVGAQSRQQAQAFTFRPSPPATDADLAQRPIRSSDVDAAEPARAPAGPLPTPFGGGVRPSWSGSGIKPPWGG